MHDAQADLTAGRSKYGEKGPPYDATMWTGPVICLHLAAGARARACEQRLATHQLVCLRAPAALSAHHARAHVDVKLSGAANVTPPLRGKVCLRGNSKQPSEWLSHFCAAASSCVLSPIPVVWWQHAKLRPVAVLHAGTAIWTYLLPPGSSLADAWYFAIVTFFTIGCAFCSSWFAANAVNAQRGTQAQSSGVEPASALLTTEQAGGAAVCLPDWSAASCFLRAVHNCGHVVHSRHGMMR